MKISQSMTAGALYMQQRILPYASLYETNVFEAQLQGRHVDPWRSVSHITTPLERYTRIRIIERCWKQWLRHTACVYLRSADPEISTVSWPFARLNASGWILNQDPSFRLVLYSRSESSELMHLCFVEFRVWVSAPQTRAHGNAVLI